jgi:hypothetical protein
MNAPDIGSPLLTQSIRAHLHRHIGTPCTPSALGACSSGHELGHAHVSALLDAASVYLDIAAREKRMPLNRRAPSGALRRQDNGSTWLDAHPSAPARSTLWADFAPSSTRCNDNAIRCTALPGESVEFRALIDSVHGRARLGCAGGFASDRRP